MLRSLVLFPLVFSMTAITAAAQPSLTFEQNAVTANGLSSPSGVMLLRVSHEPQGYGTTVVTDARLIEDADGDGTVTLQLERRVPPDSLWIAVDRASGAASVAAPRPDRIRHEKERAAFGQMQRLVRSGDVLMVVLLRPGVGAWVRNVQDSGVYDDDAAPDHKLELSIERLEPIGDSPGAPRTLTRDDVVFAIDPYTLRVIELRSE